MATSSIASLFGPTAEEIVYARQVQEQTRQQQDLQQALAAQKTAAGRNYYQAGYNIAKGLAGLFGATPMMQDPRISKSIQMRKIFGEMSAEDLNDPAKLSALSGLADQYDMPELKLWLADRTQDLLDAEALRASRAAPDVTSHGLYQVPGVSEPVQGYIVGTQIYLSDTRQPAPQGTRKYTAEPAMSGVTGGEVDFVKFRLKQLFANELSADDRTLAANDIAAEMKYRMKRGVSQTQAADEVISEFISGGKLVEKDITFKLGRDNFEYKPEGSEVKQPSQEQVEDYTKATNLNPGEKLMKDAESGRYVVTDGQGNPLRWWSAPNATGE